MRIGVDIRSISEMRTGVGEYVYGLLKHLFEVDNDNEYYLFSSGLDEVDVPNFDKFNNVKRIHLRVPNKLINFFLLVFRYPHLDKLVARLAGVQRLDVWVSGNINFIALSRGVRHIAIIHDLSFVFVPDTFSISRRLWHRLVRPEYYVRSADHIVTNSQYSREDIMRVYDVPLQKVSCVYPCFSTRSEQATVEEVRNKYNLPKKFVFCLSTIEPRKNIITLIEAYKRSSLYQNNIELVIAGSFGWCADRIIDLMNQTRGVKYLGFVSEEDKSTLFALSELFVYPSLFEGFGMPVIEAMREGVPVIVSSVTSLPEIISGSAIFVDPLSLNDLIDALNDYVNNRQKYMEYGTLAKTLTDKYYSYNSVEVFREILSLE